MKRLIISVLSLAAAFLPLSAQTQFKAHVDSLVAAATPYNEYCENRRGQFKVLPKSTSDIIFLGDSITDRCEWAELFGNTDIKNRGISGDRVRWMFDRYEDIAEGHPAKLFFLAGINDLRSNTRSLDVCEMIAELLTRFRAISPETKIYVQSILPNNVHTKQNAKFANANLKVRIDWCNNWLKSWCADNGITFINIDPAFKDEEGQLNLDYTIDGLHPNALGYMIWKDLIEGYIFE